MTGLPLSPDARGGCALETDGIFITIQYRAEADFDDPSALKMFSTLMREIA